MATTASIRITKSFTYKGATQLFSNRYHLDTQPADNAAWTALADAVTAAEKAIFDSNVTIVSAIGYDAGSEVPVFNKLYSLAGTGVFTGSHPAPGDCTMNVRYSTTQRTSKNHPIYLFNYYHGVDRSDTATATTLDNVMASQKTALQSYANAWVTGFTAAGVTYKRAGPNGAVAQGALAEQFIGHRDFPR